MKNQTEALKRYLQSHKFITANDAWRELSIQRLSARISELSHAGVEICSEYVSDTNKFGEKVRYKRYWIKEPS